MSGEHRVVWFNNCSGDLWGWVDGESELGLLSVVDGQSLEEERAKSRTCATSNCVEDKEALEACTLVSELSDSVEA